MGDNRDFLMDLSGWSELQQRFQRILKLASTKGSAAAEKLSHLNWAGLDFDGGSIRLGFGWDRKKGVLQPQLVPSCLYAAFISMLWADVASKGRRILCCENPRCANVFVSERPNKIYCSHECAEKVAKRKHWRTKGSVQRQKKREEKRRSQTEG